MTIKRTAAWCTLAVACVSGFEGLRQVAYNDPVGIPTICFGETKGVKIGDRATVEECKALLAGSLEIADQAVTLCVHVPLPDARRAAIVSFTYNVGGNTLCRSSVARLLNAGDVAGGCGALLLYTKARGVTLPGLVRRRQAEHAMCMQGVGSAMPPASRLM